MIASVATIVFLVALLAIAGIGAVIFEESAAKIRAALHGRSLLAVHRPVARPVPVSSRVRSQRPVRAEAQWRAAA